MADEVENNETVEENTPAESQQSSSLIVTSVDGKGIGIEDFNNIKGQINGTDYNLQNLMNSLYALSNSIIISDTKPGKPVAGKGFWLDTSNNS